MNTATVGTDTAWKPSLHCMIDLETMSSNSNAAIVSIGACTFSASVGITGKFYINVSLQDCMKYGLHVDSNTVMWWLKQSEEARSALDADPKAPLHVQPSKLSDALTELEKFLNYRMHEYKIWGNGATFDNVVLANAYRALGDFMPMNFRNDSCYRTMKNTFGIPLPERKGTHHNALDDAVYQAEHLIEIFKHLGIQ